MSDPSKQLIEDEELHLFMCYCTLIMNLVGKKISIQNVFVHTLDNEKYRDILKDLLSLETDYAIVKIFLDFDPLIAKSKYVTKYLNKNKKRFEKQTSANNFS